MKKYKFNDYDREKKIHRVVKSNKQSKYKKQVYNYDVNDEVFIEDVGSKKSSKQK